MGRRAGVLALLLSITPLLSGSASPARLERSEEEALMLYEGWLLKHQKSYNSLDEKQQRFQVFRDNLLYIDEHNAAAVTGVHTFRLGLNRFADVTNEEYRARFLGLRSTRRLDGVGSDRYSVADGESLPESVDWRDKGAVAPIRDQGSCGSCWAFSAISAVEGINQIATGNMIPLSEQELVDCDTAYNEGCNGGLMDLAFDFIIKNGGIDSEDDYPYVGVDGRCDSNRKNARVVAIDGYERVPANSEAALRKAVANQPVSASIEGSGRAFQLYESGIFYGACDTELDHGVTVVGYGSENNSDYWIVRNSWGRSWGEDGYIRMGRNAPKEQSAYYYGVCGIAMEAYYPTKTGPNPPNPGPSPPSPATPPSASCDGYYFCPDSSTCCCIYEYAGFCLAWGCCPLESAACCDDHSSCCPADYPVCYLQAGLCLSSDGSPLIGVKPTARVPAKPYWALSIVGGEIIGTSRLRTE